MTNALDTFNAPAQFVHPTEASHGGLGMITTNDVCLVISNSGETKELADLFTYCRRFAILTIAITRNKDGTLAQQADVTLLLPDAPEACLIGIAPTTSPTATLAIGDAVAVGVGALFMKVHEDPDNAPSDGPNMVRINELKNILKRLVGLDDITIAT